MAKQESEKCPKGISSLEFLNRDYSKGIKPSGLVSTHLGFRGIASEDEIKNLMEEAKKPLP